MIKKYEAHISNFQPEYRFKPEVMIGQLYIIYPTHSAIDMTVIAKCEKFIDTKKLWGNFRGYIINPEENKGKEWGGPLFLEDWKNSRPTQHETELFYYYEELNKYNL